MITTKDNNGNPIGFIETLVSNKEVMVINATQNATTVVTRNRESGEVKQEVFCGKNPLVTRG
jgi:hypothetical protein